MYKCLQPSNDSHLCNTWKTVCAKSALINTGWKKSVSQTKFKTIPAYCKWDYWGMTDFNHRFVSFDHFLTNMIISQLHINSTKKLNAAWIFYMLVVNVLLAYLQYFYTPPGGRNPYFGNHYTRKYWMNEWNKTKQNLHESGSEMTWSPCSHILDGGEVWTLGWPVERQLSFT